MKRMWLMLPAMLALAGWLAGGCSGGQPVSHLDWMTDVPKALEKAKAEKKLVLLDFTGSDWCPPCKALYKTVLTSGEFEAYAEKNLVVVEVDYPNDKPQSEELKQANQALAKKYEIEGYPTIILLDADGKLLSKEVGYSGAGPREFIAGLEKARGKG